MYDENIIVVKCLLREDIRWCRIATGTKGSDPSVYVLLYMLGEKLLDSAAVCAAVKQVKKLKGRGSLRGSLRISPDRRSSATRMHLQGCGFGLTHGFVRV